jgi:hypothetical protein
MKKILLSCFALLFMFAVAATVCVQRGIAFDDMGKSTTVNGWAVDDKCGAKAAHEGNEECTKKCLAGGAKLVIVSDADQKVLKIENPDALKGHEGHHVAVTGHVMGDSIHVESVKML